MGDSSGGLSIGKLLSQCVLIFAVGFFGFLIKSLMSTVAFEDAKIQVRKYFAAQPAGCQKVA